jgi:23S rRNA (adenine2503-C2)-methyltransferase
MAVHFFNLDKQELEQLLGSWGMPRFRADQLCKWVYERGVTDPAQMTDFSAKDRQKLASEMVFTTLNVLQQQNASDGTRKLLLEVPSPKTDANALAVLKQHSTECVMIPAENEGGTVRRTACISSQVGCPVGCRFCASGIGGLEFNLTTGQIVEQVWHLNRMLNAEADQAAPPRTKPEPRISNIVFMGMGEPLSNFANVTKAVHTLTAPWAFNISARKITISTVGLPAAIRRLADTMDLPITLALSLHAPNDELRRQLIPWAEYTTVDDLMAAVDDYFKKTGREVTIEYILLGGVNDRPEHAAQLAKITRRLRCHVNLIRYNEVNRMPYRRPETEDVRAFQERLRAAGVNVHIRASRGRDIAAACGQLRHEASATA